MIRDDHPGHVAAALEPLPEDLLRRLLVPAALHQNIQPMTVLIDGPPEVMAFTVAAEKHLIEVPLITRPGTPAAYLVGLLVAKLAAPLPDGFIGHDHPTGAQECFDIAVAETAMEVQPDCVADDLGWRTVILVWVGWHGCFHRASMPHRVEPV